MQIRRTWLLTIALMSGIVLAACGHPSDASMEKRFVTHESDFNQLLALSKEDCESRQFRQRIEMT